MKINIQKIEKDLFEIKDRISTDFLGEDIARFYKADSDIRVLVDKFGNDFRIKIWVNTTAHYACDRCLAEYDEPFEASIVQVFQIGEGRLTEDDEITILPANSTEIDLKPVLRELFYLNHPVKMLCRDDCPGICPHCGADLNRETCRCTQDAVDPRWEKLRKLIK